MECNGESPDVSQERGCSTVPPYNGVPSSVECTISTPDPCSMLEFGGVSLGWGLVSSATGSWEERQPTSRDKSVTGGCG